MEQSLGKRISQYRKSKGLTQDKLAEQLGVTAQAVSKWENDQSCPDITMLPKLAEIFDITTDELLGRSTGQKVHQAEVVDETQEESAGIHFSTEKGGHWSFTWDSGRKHAITFAIFVFFIIFSGGSSIVLRHTSSLMGLASSLSIAGPLSTACVQPA